MQKFHRFHLVDPSPWPLMGSIAAFSSVVAFVGAMHGYELFFSDFIFHFLNLIAVAGFWWRDVIREATFGGCHTRPVQKGLKMGFALFLISEGMLFFSFFWAFFYLAGHPSGSSLGTHWTGHIYNDTVPPNQIPLINTYVLLFSGAALTWSHHGIISGRLVPFYEGLVLTLILGFVFLVCQAQEYRSARFDISDGAFGSTFYLLTGFHGVHVLVGWVFLGVALYRAYHRHFTPTRHIGFEMAIWYWHFVDLIWLLVFFCLYVYPTAKQG